MSKGYIYIAVCDEWGDICKVGRTNNPDRRLREFNGASQFSEVSFEVCVEVKDDKFAEGTIHRVLQQEGKWVEREFFRSIHRCVQVVAAYVISEHPELGAKPKPKPEPEPEPEPEPAPVAKPEPKEYPKVKKLGPIAGFLRYPPFFPGRRLAKALGVI